MANTRGQWSFTRLTTIGQLEALEVRHPRFSATLFLQGAHLTHFAPANEANWLWLSREAVFKPGNAIRGGIPICWPWFGVPDQNPQPVKKNILTGASHGFARKVLWSLEDVRESAQEVELSLSLRANEDFSEAWRGNALVLATFTFSSRSVQIAVTTTNLDDQPMSLTQALHTYLPTSDVRNTEVLGLEETGFVDTLQQWSYFHQQGPVRFQGEFDAIYESGGPLRVKTPEGCRRLSSVGSDSTVVWNPGPTKAASLSDFPDADWPRMVCVETANALSDYRVINEGQSHTIGVTIHD